ncbi:MAG TPA: histidine kinase dimerization/phospho-acceptor domain-containing protein [Pyrinomonadaceae bacterium]|jgi:signal transduction histidine kinase
MIENQSEDGDVHKLQRVRHEINNALTAVLGNTQILLLRANLDEKSRARIEKIEEQAKRIRELAAELKED